MQPIYADRSARGKLRLSGEQDLWFLHQILTQSFEDMSDGDVRDAALLTAHGRMVGYLEAIRANGSVLVHFEDSLIGSLPEALRRYVFATRVEIEDLTDSHGLVLIVGDGWRDLASSVALQAVLHPTRSVGADAGYLWIERSEVEGVIAALEASGCDAASESDLEVLRIDNVVPRWGKDMGPKTIPQEVGLDRWAVHFDKGCYVGQEAMAKIHFRGKVNRRLARLEGSGLTEGATVASDGTMVGTVTSVAGGRGLAVLKHTIEPGQTVEVDGQEVRVAT
jgi:tRNA-modifying protein YgfZ